MNLRITDGGQKVTEGEQILIGGNSRYRQVCARCFYSNRIDLIGLRVRPIFFVRNILPAGASFAIFCVSTSPVKGHSNSAVTQQEPSMKIKRPLMCFCSRSVWQPWFSISFVVASVEQSVIATCDTRVSYDKSGTTSCVSIRPSRARR